MNTFAWKMRVVACTVVLCWATISEEAAALDTEIQNTSQILKIHNFSMILHRAGKKTTYRTTYPKFLVGPVLDAKSKISIKFMVSYGDEARSFRQVFVRIYNSSTHREIFYLPEYAEDNHTYHLKLDLSKELESFDYVSGNYTMEMIIADPDIPSGELKSWKFSSLAIEFSTSGSRNLAKVDTFPFPEINMILAEDDPSMSPAPVIMASLISTSVLVVVYLVVMHKETRKELLIPLALVCSGGCACFCMNEIEVSNVFCAMVLIPVISLSSPKLWS
eukprot:m.6403 g.6403  ORF g.6403 m.6403 type:complete len:276 (+) comp3528_c0_seq2:86-913(+)